MLARTNRDGFNNTTVHGSWSYQPYRDVYLVRSRANCLMRLDVRVSDDVEHISYRLELNAVFSKEIKRTVHSQAVNLGQYFWQTVPVFLRLVNKKCACFHEAQHD